MRGQSAGEQRASSVVSSLALDRYLKARERLEEQARDRIERLNKSALNQVKNQKIAEKQ